MVAYSFAPQFVHEVETLIKRQTVRAYRKRHAYPGETIQLYTGMRTRQCRKLVNPDPICVDVRGITIEVATYAPRIITGIEIDGMALDEAEIEAFAIADGFGSEKPGVSAQYRMGRFWLASHGEGNFAGVVIRWRPS